MRGGGPQTRAGGLSGGNQQKVVLAREIDRDPKVLIAAQPTRGLDVGAIEFVHRRLIEERDEGRAILLVSLELEEVLSLSDRILVMYEGEIVGEFPPTATEEELGVAMTGGEAERGGRVSDDPGRDPPVQPYGQTPTAPDEPPESFAARIALAQRAGGILAPLLTVVIAFVIGGLVVLVTTGKNPLETYKAIFEGSGLNWFFPWVTGEERVLAGVQPPADAHRDDDARSSSASRSRSRSAAACSTSAARASTSSGAILAVWIGSSFEGMNPVLHIVLAIVVGTAGGRA